MESKITGYKAIGRVVYSNHANGGESLIKKCADAASAILEARELQNEFRASAVTMTDSEMYRLQGRMGLCREEDDF